MRIIAEWVWRPTAALPWLAATAVFAAGLLPAPDLAAASPQQAQSCRPNIVWIWADNLAYGDLSIYGNDRAKTPVIDQLARDGARFSQYYVAHVVCSPSRAALLTGRQPFRVGIVDVLRPDGPSGIPDDEITIAEMLREQGYATQAIGKWHLGDRQQYLPTQHGFDHYFGIPYSMDMLPTILYRDNEIVDDLIGGKVEDITIRYTNEAIEFIEQNKSRPFFLYFSHTIPHPPLNLPEAARTPGRPIYDDAIEHMDQQTGRLLRALDHNGLRENTLVFFTSDNGPMNRGGDTGGLRGRIGDSYEGGVRVPFMARWPGRVPAGRVVDTPAIAYDIFPTLVKLAGGEIPADRTYDGQDIWPVIAGEETIAKDRSAKKHGAEEPSGDQTSGKGSFTRRQPFVWVHRDKVTSIRDGHWKLHVSRRGEPLPELELYDIEADPQEKNSLTNIAPEVVKRLQIYVDQFQKQVPYAWRLYYPVRDPAKKKSGVRRK